MSWYSDIVRYFFGRPSSDPADYRLELPSDMRIEMRPTDGYGHRFRATYRGHVGTGDTRFEAAKEALRSWRGGES